jgi:hypothetical protein
MGYDRAPIRLIRRTATGEMGGWTLKLPAV